MLSSLKRFSVTAVAMTTTYQQRKRMQTKAFWWQMSLIFLFNDDNEVLG